MMSLKNFPSFNVKCVFISGQPTPTFFNYILRITLISNFYRTHGCAIFKEKGIQMKRDTVQIFYFFSFYHENVKSWQRSQKSECARSF